MIREKAMREKRAVPDECARFERPVRAGCSLPAGKIAAFDEVHVGRRALSRPVAKIVLSREVRLMTRAHAFDAANVTKIVVSTE
jgi:hypothetical protein